MLPHGDEALANWLKKRLERANESAGHDIAGIEPMLPAAVLIGIVTHLSGPTVLLTRRALNLNKHPGQVSFPGGAIEPEDADAVAAALRETHEEIGLMPERVRVLGEMGSYVTASAFRVTPVVGLVRPGFLLKPDPREVAEVFELPLAALIDPGHYERRWVMRSGMRVRSHFIELEGITVWGATAGMLVGLGRLLGMKGEPVETDKIHTL
ncbi:8-oxo-dGTP pyrophosphatase MutT, NUDIX family [Formivibrio citricus]|uniref:8-oxo-dGTP pyrophosphatase MutT, NUDIX family n=1 Tax=Formivibrio citricus TaxID=83765 RepID=A0A1I4X822_9NEIS|nr:CoA pyrophosphatase [Formivibrio citricus]SFN21586.1 8-oxo-dGTP pyrophosphatase MutT, NUDIX family [Formivibrio citricus]